MKFKVWMACGDKSKLYVCSAYVNGWDHCAEFHFEETDPLFEKLSKDDKLNTVRIRLQWLYQPDDEPKSIMESHGRRFGKDFFKRIFSRGDEESFELFYERGYLKKSFIKDLRAHLRRCIF